MSGRIESPWIRQFIVFVLGIGIGGKPFLSYRDI